MTDLIERLRRYQHDITRGLEPKAEYVYELTGKAADEIERLKAELADANNSFGSQTANWPGLATRIEDLKSRSRKDHREIERLRAALEAIVNHPEVTNYESPSYYHGRDELQEIAREALKDE